MSDFDFDEIDKAVNSALNSQTASDSSRINDVNRELNIPTRGSISLSASNSGRNLTDSQDVSVSSSASTQPSVDEDINAAVNSIVADVAVTSDASGAAVTDQDNSQVDSSAVTADSSKPGLPTRRSGRFMDVVHPSSDMRTSSMTPRKPANISPLSSGIEPDLEPEEPADKSAAIDLELPSEIESVGSITADESSLNNGLKPEDVPPPIDLDRPINTELTSQIDSLLSGDSLETPAAEPVATPAPTPSPETEAPQTDSQPTATDEVHEVSSTEHSGLDFEETPDLSRAANTEPLTSPFIEGVSVDKRPLGSTNPNSEITNEQPETSAPAQESTSEVTDRKSGYSEELKHPDDVTAKDVLPDELDNKLVSIESTTAGSSNAPNNEAKLDMSNETTGPTSIAKQYKEKARTDDQEASGDIFDTKNYHKPIKDESSTKRMSPLVIVATLIFVVLLIAASVFALLWSGLFTLPF